MLATAIQHKRKLAAMAIKSKYEMPNSASKWVPINGKKPSKATINSQQQQSSVSKQVSHYQHRQRLLSKRTKK